MKSETEPEIMLFHASLATLHRVCGPSLHSYDVAMGRH